MSYPRGLGSRLRALGLPGLAALVALLSALTLWTQLDRTGAGAQPPEDATATLGDLSSGVQPGDGADVEPAAPARRATSTVVAQPPRAARLPSGRVVPIRAVGTRSDGLLDVPSDIRTAGWWKGGARIGDPFGSTLVAAHVDSTTQGLGPYAELLEVRPGQKVTVVSAGLEQVFVVRSLRLLPQGPLTDRRWLFAPDGPRRLTLVTCAPPYDPARDGYQNLAVVTAVPLADPRPKGT